MEDLPKIEKPAQPPADLTWFPPSGTYSPNHSAPHPNEVPPSQLRAGQGAALAKHVYPVFPQPQQQALSQNICRVRDVVRASFSLLMGLASVVICIIAITENAVWPFVLGVCLSLAGFVAATFGYKQWPKKTAGLALAGSICCGISLLANAVLVLMLYFVTAYLFPILEKVFKMLFHY